MSDCELVQTAAGCFVCRQCGRPLRVRSGTRLPVRRKCAAANDAPARSDDEIATLMQHCRTNVCGAFDALRDACRHCGCASTRRAAWLARLRRGTCPVGKW